MQKYSSNPEFVEIMNEFSKIMGSHFENIATQKEEPEDPIAKIIDTDPEVKQILQDPKVMHVLQIL